jgi:hypothetical protein
VAIAPALAELREVCQPYAKLQSRNGEHWAGRLYMRRISLHATRQLVRTRVTPDALTWSMVICGAARLRAPLRAQRTPTGSTRRGPLGNLP